jgi:uncharacterized protein (DUF433 family)
MDGQSAIINRGRGPEIQGTRVTVNVIFEYVLAGRERDWIAADLRLTPPQVQAALDYIEEHKNEVQASYARVQQRIAQGNPAWVNELLKRNRPRFEALIEKCRNKNGTLETRPDAEDHVRS